MRRDILASLIPAAVIIAGGLFANQAAAFGVPGSFPPDALSSVLSGGAAEVAQGTSDGQLIRPAK